MAEKDRVQIEGPATQSGFKPRRPEAVTPPLLRLQRLAGNAAVSDLIAQREGENIPTQTGGGGGTVTVGAMVLRKPATITVTTSNGAVTDASAEIGNANP